MQEKIKSFIIQTLKETDEQNDKIDEKSKIFGTNGVLDSISLVMFVTDLEERLADELDIDIVLADEKAMSKTVSPFRDVNSLTEYIISQIKG